MSKQNDSWQRLITTHRVLGICGNEPRKEMLFDRIDELNHLTTIPASPSQGMVA